jgi:hypothetical protein
MHAQISQVASSVPKSSMNLSSPYAFNHPRNIMRRMQIIEPFTNDDNDKRVVTETSKPKTETDTN